MSSCFSLFIFIFLCVCLICWILNGKTKMYIIWNWEGAQVHLPGSEWKQNNSFKMFWFTIVHSYFIRQPKMTPQVCLCTHTAWNGDVFLAPACYEFLPQLCLKLSGTGAFLSILRWRRKRGMREGSGIKRKNPKPTWKENNISNIYKCISLPSMLASVLLAICKVSIHFSKSVVLVYAAKSSLYQGTRAEFDSGWHWQEIWMATTEKHSLYRSLCLPAWVIVFTRKSD